MDEFALLVHQRLVLLYARASSLLEEIRASGMSAHLMSVDGNPFPDAGRWTRAPYPIPVIDVKGRGSIGFDPAGVFLVFAVPVAEAQPTYLDALSDCFKNVAFLGADRLEDYRSGHNNAVRAIAAAVHDGETALLVVVRLDMETQGVLRVFDQASMIMAGNLPTLRSPCEPGHPDTSTT